MKAILKHVRVSPKKASLVAGLVRGKGVGEALNFLKFLPKKAGKILWKIVRSAACNAENNFGQDQKALKISRILVTKGRTLKRGVPASRGRVAPIKKRTSHITVEVAATSASKQPAQEPTQEKVEKKN